MTEAECRTRECVDLGGQAAVVTGSSRGIGRAVAEALARAGAGVVVNGRDEAIVADTVREMRAMELDVVACAGDASDFAAAGRLVDTCLGAFGAIDIVVTCAGIAEPPGTSILDLEPADWQRLIDTHLTSVFNVCRHAVPHMQARGRGALVLTSSHAALGHYGGTGYPAGKGGVNSLGFALAAELREHGIRVNTVCPGARTRLSTGPDYARHIEDLHRRGLVSEGVREASLSAPGPEHVAPLYVFLASEAAEAITGRLFSASGGYVGVFAPASESLLAFRNAETEGPWPVDALAATLRAKLENAP
jgi:NAD(P)-dependent dehydrogenase (short-subunit alcohol dehydrogenase family)